MNITNLVRSRVKTFSLEVNITNLAGSKVKARRITCGDWKAFAKGLIYYTRPLAGAGWGWGCGLGLGGQTQLLYAMLMYILVG